MKAGKVWGETRTLVSHPLCAVEHLTISAGARCSMHMHAHKANWFYVQSGTLRIVVKKNDYDLTDVTTLGPGESCVVGPGEYHRFEAETDVVALEGYYPPVLSADIHRLDCGGVG